MESKHKKIVLFIVAFIVFGVIFYYLDAKEHSYRLKPQKTSEFIGTYLCESSPKCSIVVDPEDNQSFYVFDYDNEIFFKEQFTKTSDTTYLLLGNEFFDSQEITCDGLTFKIVMNNQELLFEKSSDTISLPSPLYLELQNKE